MLKENIGTHKKLHGLSAENRSLSDPTSITVTSKGTPLKSFHNGSTKLELFELKATPSFSPIDFNIFTLTEILDSVSFPTD